MDFIKILRTSRPPVWICHWCLLFYGGLQNPSFNPLDYKFLITLFVFSLPFSLCVYAFNDYYDRESDSLNPRKTSLFGERHTTKTIKRLKTWSFAGFGISIFLMSFVNVYALLGLVLLVIGSILYSSSVTRFKSIPIVDAIAGGGCYFYLTTVTGFLVFLNGRLQIADIIQPAFIVLTLVGIVGQSMAIVADEKPDKAQHINTSSVLFGSNAVITVCITLLGICLYLVRTNMIFSGFILVLAFLCSLFYWGAWRTNKYMQVSGGFYFPFIFLLVSVLLYFINPGLLAL